MQAQCKVIRKQHRTTPTEEHRPSNFEYLFMLANRSRASRILVICWTRLGGFLPQVMRNRVPRLILLLLSALLLAPAASAQRLGDEPRAEPVRREILAVYDSREEPRPDQTRIHRFAEMPLNHLGFVVTFWDVSAGLPSAERAANIRGVITWFRRAPPASFYRWGQEQVRRGVRMVVLGDSGPPSGNASLSDANRLFAEIGFGLSGEQVDITYGARILHRDQFIGFERPLDPVLPAFPIVGTFGHDVSSHLILEHREGSLVLRLERGADLSRGGFVANGYFVYEEPVTGRTKWIIDPFAFFQKAFGADTMPIPDVTTLSGRRTWFSHIDGDGWNNVSRVEAYRDKPTIASTVILRELIAPYPDLPVAVGVIGADIDERYGTPEAGRQAARDLYALPQVEVATHSYTHPYQWSFFENYDRRLEERLIGPDETEWKVGARRPHAASLARRLFPGLARKSSETRRQVHRRRSAARLQRFSLRSRPGNSRRDHRRRGMAPEGKRGTLYLWSGGAEPFEGAIARTRRLGLRNLNGGDSRFDADYPSISYLVADLARRRCRAADLCRQRQRLHLHHRRRRPRPRLSASGSDRQRRPKIRAGSSRSTSTTTCSRAKRPPSSQGVRHHLDAARQALLTPIAASHYAAIADGFFSTQMQALGELDLADPESRRTADRALRRCRRPLGRFQPQRRRDGPARREPRSMSRSTKRARR